LEPYAGALQFKAGKSKATSIYYVDHTKLKGLDRDEKEKRASDLATVKAEEEALKEHLKQTLQQTVQLRSEPTNEEAAARLEEEGATVKTLEEEVESARKLKVNEQHKIKTKKKIQYMAGHWRARKRLCLDFLVGLEENTDGSVQAKACLKGQGQIALDNDEDVASSEKLYAKEKRARGTGLTGGNARSAKKSKCHSSLGVAKDRSSTTAPDEGVAKDSAIADENFVAVLLDSQHAVHRVYVDEKGCL
jgi:hypothetical protein